MINFKEKILAVSRKNSERLAVVDHDNNQSYTYQDLIEFSQGLLNRDIKNKKIGIYIEKSADYIAAVYSITLSSNSFIPLDPSLPDERLRYIVNDSKIDYILTNNKNITSFFIQSVTVPTLELDRYTRSVSMDFDMNQLFYTIYTSGTTGIPKGVQLSYKGIDNVIQQQIDILNLDKDNIYLFLSISFDASLSDIYCSLLSGSTLFIKEDIKKNVADFINYIKTNNISYTDIPPSYIKLIDPAMLPSLKSIIIGGEVADPKTVCQYVKFMRVVNVYGPTEATICTSYSVCDSEWFVPYIGKPLKGVEYTVFDDDMNVVYDGSGELYIAGIQLAIGYTNKKITEERFVTVNNTDYYKTGDKVIVSRKGIEFVGRIDRQIKHNGQLICLEEIEQAINTLDAVKSVSVVYKNRKLYAYYEGIIEKETIVEFLMKLLPPYMIPQFFINNIIPKTVNGKNDSSFLSKNNTLFEQVSIVFKRILEIDEFDESLSFSQLGADSINFIQLQESLNNIGIQIPYNYLFNKNTIEDILNYRSYAPLTKYEIVENFDLNMIKVPDTSTFIDSHIALVTGSNGSLGMHLLQEIQPHFDKIYCLVRGDSPEEATKKFKDMKHNYALDFDLSNIDIIPITNLSDKYLGLTETQYNELTGTVSHIYHNAANVNNMKTFEHLYSDNVVSTVNIINFSFTGLLKKINYASTLSVYVSGEHAQYKVFKEEVLDLDNELLFNGYAQTKWLSDYIMSLCNHYQQIKQFRLGLLVPDCFTAKDRNSFLFKVIELIDQETVLPDDHIGACFDFTPVSWAANTIKNISIVDSPVHIYNVTTNHKVYYSELLSLLGKHTMNSKEWFANRHDYLSQLLSILNKFEYSDMNLFEMTYVDKFENNNCQPYIQHSFKLDDILRNYINYFNS